MTNNRTQQQQQSSSSSSSSSSLVVTIGTYCISSIVIYALGIWTGRILVERSKSIIKDETDEQQVVVVEHHDEKIGEQQQPAPRRFGSVIQLKPEMYRRYRELHDNVWPDVIKRMYDSNIRNFVIYYHPATNTLYQHYEWIGHIVRYQEKKLEKTIVLQQYRTSLLSRADSTIQNMEIEWYKDDMDAITNDPTTRIWWKECEPCQVPFTVGWDNQILPSDGGTIQWWTPLECVCHIDSWPTSYSTPWNRNDPDFIKLE